MKEILKDLYGDWSSGILIKLLAFVAAIEIAVVCLIEGVDLQQGLVAVGAFLGVVALFQGTQSIASVGAIAPTAPPPNPLGLLVGPAGSADLGRWIKLISFLIAWAIVNVAIFVPTLRGHVQDATGFAAPFLGMSTATEITQKATGT